MKNYLHLLFLSVFCLALTNVSHAQKSARSQEHHDHKRCSTNEYMQLLEQRNPDVWNTDAFEAEMKRLLKNKDKFAQRRSTYKVPVIVHVIHSGEAVGVGKNISAAQVYSQIRVMNEDFTRTNPDADQTRDEFIEFAASMDIEFVPALVDTYGNVLAEPGINRVNGLTLLGQSTWSGPDGNSDTQLKPNTIWDPSRYFNLWVVQFTDPTLLGYAQWPDINLVGNPGDTEASTDGVIMSYRAFGSNYDANGNLVNNFPLGGLANKGRTTTHEVGHWLGLRHIWGDGPCREDDFVDDTPRQGSDSPFANNCDFSLNTCGGGVQGDLPDMIENFMDYSADACMNLFTQGQVDRMIVVLEQAPRRASLLTSNVAQLPDDLFEAEIGNSGASGCGPVVAQFTDESTVGANSNPITSWTWNFDKNGLGGATPSTFSGQNPPSVVFSNAGAYEIELTINNGTESSTASTTVEVFIGNVQFDNLNNGTLDTIRSAGTNPFGYISGHNNYSDAVKAERFDDLIDGNELSSADFLFSVVEGTPTSQIKFNVYDNDGPGGLPNSIISTTSIPLSDIQIGDWTNVDFPDVTIDGTLYIGVELDYTTGDRLALAHNSNGETSPTTAYEQWNNGVWNSFNDGTTSTWRADVSLAVRANVACPVATPPSAAFEANATTICAGETVQFTDMSTDGPTSWQWNFGDGTVSDEQNPTHTYTNGGTFTVALEVTNDAGSSSEVKTNYITVQTPAANFAATASSTTICVGETVNLGMTGTIGAPYSWEVDGNQISTGVGLMVTPTETTTYTAVCDNGVCRLTDNITIIVNPAPDAPIISANGVELTASSAVAQTYQWLDDNGIIDGATSSTYTVVATGNYVVQITDANGCMSASAPFSIALQPPVADFDAFQTTVCEDSEVDFTDNSTNSPTAWAWDFGDGNTSTEQNPTHVYAAAGDYTVALTVTNTFGNSTETKVNYITVQEQPSGFAANADATTICPGADVLLTMTGTFGAQYSWEVNGNQVATGPSNTVNPTVTTTYTAICDNGICAVDDEVTITVTPAPAAPTITNDAPRLSASGDGTFQWFLNGNPIDGATSADYTATEDGDYTVTVTDGNGCTSELSAVATVANTAVIDAVLDAAISIFPNPTNAELNVVINANRTNNLFLQLTDVAGRTIKFNHVVETNNVIDMSALSAGVYILKIGEVDGGFAIRQIVKH